MRSPGNVLLAASLLTTLASAAQVTDSHFLPTAPGTWKPWQFYAYADDRRVFGARPADVKDVEAQLLRLNAIIKKTDGFTNPVGFSIETGGYLSLVSGRFSAIAGEPALTVRPFPSRLGFGPHPVLEYGSGATAKRVDTGEVEHLWFYVNEVAQPLMASSNSTVPEFEKLDLNVVRLAPPQPDVFGLSRYGDTLVLKKSAAPIWAAVTLAETLELVTRGIDERLTRERDIVSRLQTGYDDIMDPKKRDERIAQYKAIAPRTKDPSAYVEQMTKAEDGKQRMAGTQLLPQIASAKAVVTKSEQELAGAKAMAAGLSASDKTAPACYASGGASLSRFRRASGGGCEPLVRPNWALFNPSLPRSAPQVLTITGFAPCLVPDRKFPHVGGCTANKRLMESIDKAALLAWLQ